VGGYYDSEVEVATEAERLRADGFAGMKFKVGGLSPEDDAKRFREARRGAGDGFALLADANQGWRPEEAMRFVGLVEDHDLHWFEEPCRWHNDRRAMRDVRLGARVRVCAGQSEFTAGGCRDLMVDGAIDVCNFDASWSGGPTEWRRVAAMAFSFDVSMAHHEEPHIGGHLLASIPHGTFMETFQRDRDPIWWNLVANRPPLVDGHVTLSDTPGLGWELDRDFIERYRVGPDRTTGTGTPAAEGAAV
jgi:L-alanine-DL-glutamate epimerase-like enolase superfamily enzyme